MLVLGEGFSSAFALLWSQHTLPEFFTSSLPAFSNASPQINLCHAAVGGLHAKVSSETLLYAIISAFFRGCRLLNRQRRPPPAKHGKPARKRFVSSIPLCVSSTSVQSRCHGPRRWTTCFNETATDR